MSKKILIINGHPNSESFNFALSNAYQKGALESGAKVDFINIKDLNFNPSLEFGYKKTMDLEPDLEKSVKKIKWANHLVFIHPVWWGSFPAIMKGFIDRVFLPKIAFDYKDDVIEKLLKYKSARIIATMDQPGWYYKSINSEPSTKQLKNITLKFCGVSPVKTTYFGIIITSTKEKREKWLKKAEILGKQDAK